MIHHRDKGNLAWKVSEVFDDGDLDKQDPARLKAFNDNTEEEQRTVEKYTTTCFKAHSARITCNNSYDESQLPTIEQLDNMFRPRAKHKEFFNAVRPSYSEKIDESNMMAVFKRANVVLFTKHGVFYRRAGKQQVDVPFVKYPKYQDPDLITAEAKPMYNLWKVDKEANEPENYQHASAWSLCFLKICMQGKTPPRSEVWIKHDKSVVETRARLEDPEAMLGPVAPAPSSPLNLNLPQSSGAGRAASASGNVDAPDLADKDLFGPDNVQDDRDNEDVFGFGGGMSPPDEERSAAPATPKAGVQVKIEPGAFKRKLSALPSQVLGLCTPSPKAAKSSQDLEQELEKLLEQELDDALLDGMKTEEKEKRPRGRSEAEPGEGQDVKWAQLGSEG